MPAVWVPLDSASGWRACRRLPCWLLWRSVWPLPLWRVRPGAAPRRSPGAWLPRPVAGRPPPVAAPVRPAASPRRVLSWPARRPGAGPPRDPSSPAPTASAWPRRSDVGSVLPVACALRGFQNGLLFGLPPRIVGFGAGLLCGREFAGLGSRQVRIKAVRMAGEEGIPGFLGADLGRKLIIDTGFGFRIDRLRRRWHQRHGLAAERA